MDISFKQFMGLKTPIKSQADCLLNDSFGEIIDTLRSYVRQDSNKKKYNIYELMEKSEKSNPEFDYFWEWMREEGLSLVSLLDKRLPDTDEVLEFLAYRKMVLEMDAKSDSADMFFLSITEFLTTVSDFISVYFESIAINQEFHDQERISLPAKGTMLSKNYWEPIKSSAPFGAGLLLYN